MSLVQQVIANIIRYVEQMHGFEVVSESAQHRDAASGDGRAHPEVIDDQLTAASGYDGLSMNGDPPLQASTELASAPLRQYLRALHRQLLKRSDDEAFEVKSTGAAAPTVADVLPLCDVDVLEPGAAIERLATLGVPGLGLGTDASPYTAKRVRISDPDMAAGRRLTADVLYEAIRNESDLFDAIRSVASFATDVSSGTGSSTSSTFGIAEYNKWTFQVTEPANQRKTTAAQALRFAFEAMSTPADVSGDASGPTAALRAKAIAAVGAFFIKLTNQQNSLAFCVYLVALGDFLHQWGSPVHAETLRLLAADEQFFADLDAYVRQLAESLSSSASTDLTTHAFSVTSEVSVKSSIVEKKSNVWQVPLLAHPGTTSITLRVKSQERPIKCTHSDARISKADLEAVAAAKAITFTTPQSNAEKAVMKLVATLDAGNDLSSHTMPFDRQSTQGDPVVLIRSEGSATVTATANIAARVPAGWMATIAQCGSFALFSLIQARIGDVDEAEAGSGADLAANTETDTTTAASGGAAAAEPSSGAVEPTSTATTDDKPEAVEESTPLSVALLLRQGLVGPLDDQDGSDAVKVLAGHADTEPLVVRMLTAARIQDSAKPSARAVFAVMLCHLPAQVATQELQQRWNLDWASRLQGEPNAQVRKYLAQLCDFIVKRVHHPKSVSSDGFRNGFGAERKSNQVLQGLMSLLLAHHPVSVIEAELKRRSQAAARVPPALRSCERLLLSSAIASRAATAVVTSWLHKDRLHYLEGLQGCGAAIEDEIRQALFSFINAGTGSVAPDVQKAFAAATKLVGAAGTAATDRARSLFALLDHPFAEADIAALLPTAAGHATAYSLLLDVLQALVKTSASAPAIDGAADISVSSTLRRVIPNDFYTTRGGVQMLQTPRGLQVDRTGMDTLSLRGTAAWPTKLAEEQPATLYFEVKFQSKNVKRCMIGVCAPQANVEEFDVRGTKGACMLDSGAPKSSLASFGTKGDVVGCGLDIPTGEVFFTVNGVLVLSQHFSDGTEEFPFVFPFITYDTSDRSSILVNFGAAPFAFPFTEKHASRRTHATPSLDDVAGVALDSFTSILTRLIACGTNEQLDAATATTLSLVQQLPNGASAPSAARVAKSLLGAMAALAQSPRFTASRASTICTAMIAFVSTCSTAVMPTALSIIDTTLRKYPNRMSADALQKLLGQLKTLRAETATPSTVPFVPRWTNVNEELSYANAQVVKVTKEHKFTHAIGTVLPNEGVVTFSVVIAHTQAEVDAIMMLGHFYVGVTSATIGVLGSGTWKTASPPNVWALHSRLTSQLSHADEAALGNDPYLFTNGTVLTVIVDRDKGRISFKRGPRVYENVFVDLPADAELRPFVQVVGEYAWGTILPGTRTASMTPSKLAYGTAVSLMRTMLCIPASAHIVADSVREELTASGSGGGVAVPWRSLSIIGAAGDPRGAVYRHTRGSSTVRVEAIAGTRATVVGEDQSQPLFVDVADLHTPLAVVPFAPLQLSEEDDTFVPEDDDDDEDDGTTARRTADGIRSCTEAVAQYVAQWGITSVQKSMLLKRELDGRVEIEKAEAEAFGNIVAPHKAHQFEQLHQRNGTLMSGVLQGLPMPQTFTFNRRDTSDGVSIPSHYEGKLALSTMDVSGKVTMPLVGIANEAIPRTGVVNIRVKFEVDWMGLLPTLPHQVRPLPPGFFFGVCLGSYHGAKRQHALVTPPDMWAVTSLDNEENHLRHSCESMKHLWFIFDKDTIRLQIDRKAGTLTAYRSPWNGKEICLGVLFDNVPADVDLYPFVQLPIPRASALFLPESAALPRREANDVRFAHMINRKGYHCDGCLGQLAQTEVTAPNWYRCNQCSDFDLCRQCFNNHIHSGHTFTNMRATSFVVTPLTGHADTSRNATVEIPTVPVHLLDAHNVLLNDRHFRCTATSTATNSSVVWGLLRRNSATAAYECSASFAGRLKRETSLCVFGVGLVSAVLGKTREQVMEGARKSNDVVLIANDESQDVTHGAKVAVSRQHTTGFALEDTLSFTLLNNNIAVSKNGSCIRSVEVPAWASAKLCVFVFLEEKGITVSLLQDANEFVTGKVGEISQAQKLIRVTSGAANRWCALSDVHTPISVAKAHNVLVPGQQVFVARPTLSRFVECTVLKIGPADEPVTVSDGETTFAANIESIFVANNENAMRSPGDETSLFPEVKARMRRFYAKYAPEKTDADMDKAIELYSRAKGGHDAMFEALIKKYGPEPVVEVAVRRKDRSDDVGGISAVEAFTVSRLLGFVLSMLRGSSTSSDIALAAVPLMAKTITLLSTIRVAADTTTADTIPQLMAQTAIAHRAARATLQLAPADDKPLQATAASRLQVGDTAVVVQGSTSGLLVRVVNVDHADVIECTGVADGKTIMVPTSHLLASCVNPARPTEPWFTATDDAVVQLPSMGEGRWEGNMHCRNGFTFRIAVDLPGGRGTVSVTKGSENSAKVSTIACAVEDVRVVRGQRSISFLLTDGDNATLQQSLDESTLTFLASSRRRQCPKSSSGKPVVISFSGSFLNEGGVRGTWILPSGNSGHGLFWIAGSATHSASWGAVHRETSTSLSAEAPLLPDITTVAADDDDASSNAARAAATGSVVTSDALKTLIVRLALRVHVAAAAKLPLPSVSDFVAELLNTRDSSLQFALLRSAAAADPQFFAGALASLVAVCHDIKSTRIEAVTAAATLALALDISCVGVDCAAGGALFWEMYRAAAAVAHRFVNSLSALGSLVPFVARHSGTPLSSVIVMPLFAHFNRLVAEGFAEQKALSLVASILSLVYASAPKALEASQLPLKTLAFLFDCVQSMHSASGPLPAAADTATPSAVASDVAGSSGLKWLPMTKTTEMRAGSLTRGIVLGSTPISDAAPVYFEVTHPANARLVVGVAVNEFQNHCIASQAFGVQPMVGYNALSVGFDGTQIVHDTRVSRYGWAKAQAGDIIGCWIDAKKRVLRFSVNGELFPEHALPHALKVDALHPVVQVNTNPGAKIAARLQLQQHAPHECVPLEQQSVPIASDYDAARRSPLPARSVDFYAAVAHWMDSKAKRAVLAAVDDADLAKYAAQIETIEAALVACSNVINLETEDNADKILQMFSVAKRVVRKSFRKESLIIIPSIEKKQNPRTLSQVTVRWYTLFSRQKRSPEAALHNSVLGQLYRQIGSDSKMFEQTPMFMTALMMTDSGHIPIDAGGPYNQVWSLVSEEVMTGSERANFHRNPLFKYVENANGKRVVPDSKRNSATDLALFAFLGKIMGHMVRVKNPLAFEIAPFVWKYLVEDTLTIEDMYEGLEPYWRDSVIENEELLDSPEQVAEYFPDFHRVFDHISSSPTHMNRLGEIQLRKKAAEHCLIHSMDAQLEALRSGLWSTLGKGVVRALTFDDLEFLVCGDPNPSFEQVRESIVCSLPSPQNEFFWQVMKELSPKEWSDFFYFASARKRYPLAKQISVKPSGQSDAHMPVASTCFSYITMPLYRSAAQMKEKLKAAIACKDMELA